MIIYNLDGVGQDVHKVVEILGEHYKAELNHILLGFFHLLSHDNLTLDDLGRVGALYGLDIEKAYLEMFEQSMRDEDD